LPKWKESVWINEKHLEISTIHATLNLQNHLIISYNSWYWSLNSETNIFPKKEATLDQWYASKSAIKKNKLESCNMVKRHTVYSNHCKTSQIHITKTDAIGNT
jgi:hypothetical protein